MWKAATLHHFIAVIRTRGGLPEKRQLSFHLSGL